MNINELSSFQITDLYAVDRLRYVYQVVLEEQLGSTEPSVLFSSLTFFDNRPIAGAAVGGQINIFV